MRTRTRDFRMVSSTLIRRVLLSSNLGTRARTPRAAAEFLKVNHGFVSPLRRFVARRGLAHQFAGHGAGHPTAARQPLPIQAFDEAAGRAERSLDSHGNMGDHTRFDL